MSSYWKIASAKICFSLLAAYSADAEVVSLHCERLLDVRAGAYRNNATVSIRDGKVESIKEGGDGAGSIRLPGTCMPGLWDMHTHLTSDPTNSGYRTLGISVPRLALVGAKNARITLLAGFTSTRNLGSRGYADVALRDAINSGDIDGPRMLASGLSLSITGGHCDSNLLAPEFRHSAAGVANGPWEARAKVRENVKYGADVIKVCASGGVMSKGTDPGTPHYSPEELRAIVEEAHRLGKRVAAHAHGAQSIREAIEAGVDSIEHASFIDRQGLDLAIKRGTYLVFDIYNDDYILAEGAKAGMLPESIEKEKKVGKTQRENFRKAILAGAKVAFGTDSGIYPHGENWRQFPYMVEFGMKPIEAIRAATIEAAKLAGVERSGEVAAGFDADVIAVAGDPLADIRNMQQIRFVMKGGSIYRNDWSDSPGPAHIRKVDRQ